ncbi:unnamed protein product, partial [Rotaria sp. Silwood2]
MNRYSDIDFTFKNLPAVYGFRSKALVSIGEALEAIVPQIDQLLYYIQVARKHCLYPSEHGLTRDESASVYIYTMEWGDNSLYRVLNRALRSEDRESLKIWFSYLKLFHTALEKLPTVKKVIWRGVPVDIGNNFTKEEIVTWWSVNSCSSSVYVIKDFLGSTAKTTLFRIEAVNGKNVSGYTAYENQGEIILGIGTQLRVKSNALDNPQGSHIIHLVEIDDNDDEPLGSSMNKNYVTPKPSNSDAFTAPLPFTVAGGNKSGNELNQLSRPWGLYVADDRIYVADCGNHRIVEWKCGAMSGQQVAGGNGPGSRDNELIPLVTD